MFISFGPRQQKIGPKPANIHLVDSASICSNPTKREGIQSFKL